MSIVVRNSLPWGGHDRRRTRRRAASSRDQALECIASMGLLSWHGRIQALQMRPGANCSVSRSLLTHSAFLPSSSSQWPVARREFPIRTALSARGCQPRRDTPLS